MEEKHETALKFVGGDRLLRLGLILSRCLPRSWAYRIAMSGGRLMGRLFSKRRAILETNLSPLFPDPAERRRVAVEVFGHAVRAYYEMLHVITHPEVDLSEAVLFEEPGWGQFMEAYRSGTGIVLVMTHQSSFDLAGQSLAARGLDVCALVLPDTGAGYGLLNELRLAQRIRALPVGPSAVREALRTLRRGGVVAVAGDRPVKGQGVEVEFLGRPTLLPDGHVRLALRTGARVILGFCRLEEGAYRVTFRPVELAPGAGENVRENVQRIVRAMEPAIRTHPEQWHLFHRLWEGPFANGP